MPDLLLFGLTITFLVMTVGFVSLCQRVEDK